MDRNSGGPCLIVSEKGGMNIEDVDKSYIFKFPIDIVEGI